MRIGIDLGGTKIEAIALGKEGEVLFCQRVPTPRGDYEKVLRAIAGLVEAIEQHLGQRGSVGIGMPGAISPATGLAKNTNLVCFHGRPFDRDISTLLGRPVRVCNDANCFTLSEAIDGTAAGAEVVFGVIIGTGVGGGVVVRGQVLTGPNAIAGEWGHNPLPWPSPEELPGPLCYCGKKGCIETFLSGGGLVRDFVGTGAGTLPPGEIAERAGRGDTTAEAAISRYEDRMARGLASVINILDPNVIVLGGGLSNIERLYTRVPLLWGKYVFSDTVKTVLARARHGDASGVRGAAWLWPAG